MNEGIEIGHIVTDESGRHYQLITTCEHEKTGEKLLIYQQLFGGYKVLARTLESTFKSVDAAAQPAVPKVPVMSKATSPEQAVPGEQAVRARPAAPVGESQQKPGPAQKTVTDLMLDFLDERDLAKKNSILDEMSFRPDLTDSVIDNLAAAMDIVIDDGPIDLRFAQLRSCIRTRAQYELKRF